MRGVGARLSFALVGRELGRRRSNQEGANGKALKMDPLVYEERERNARY